MISISQTHGQPFTEKCVPSFNKNQFSSNLSRATRYPTRVIVVFLSSSRSTPQQKLKAVAVILLLLAKKYK